VAANCWIPVITWRTRDRSGSQMIAVGKAAGQDQQQSDRRELLGMPQHLSRAAGDGAERSHGLSLAVRAGN